MSKLKFKQIFAIISIAICIFCILPLSFVSATNFDFSYYNGGSAESLSNNHANNIAKKTMGLGINVIRIVATGISVVMLSYIGIKYMMAAPGEKAEFKKSASIYILGAILIFAAGNILTIIVNFASSNVVSG